MSLDSIKIVGSSSAASIPEKLKSIVVNEGLLHHLVVDLNARKRSGTHAVKTRSKVAGGGAKPWRQKGTGRARAGSNSSPVWVGGGVAHGPKPRSYGGRINKKEKSLGLLHAVKARLESESLFIFKELGSDKPKTAEAAKLLSEIGFKEKRSTVVVLDAKEENAIKSFRNIAACRVVTSTSANIVDLLAGQGVAFSEAAWNSFNQRFEEVAK